MNDMQHAIKVAEKSIQFAQILKLSNERTIKLSVAALLHDVGKELVNQRILNKPSKLTSYEYKTIQMHSEYSYKTIINYGYSSEIATIVLHHHENYDGTGYPDGLKGEDIPLESRIIKIIDVYDALTTKRVYREKLTHDEAINIMKEEIATFDQKLFSLFLQKFDWRNEK